MVGEADLVADEFFRRDQFNGGFPFLQMRVFRGWNGPLRPLGKLVRQTIRDGNRRDSPRLRVPDEPPDAKPELHADFGELRRFSGAGLAAEDHDLILGDRFFDFFPAGGNGEFFVVNERRNAQFTPSARFFLLQFPVQPGLFPVFRIGFFRVVCGFLGVRRGH